MKILYTPLMIVPSLDDAQRARILEAAGPGARLVEAKDRARQAAEIADADVLFGRVPNEVFLAARRLRYYQSIGAGVDAILTQDLVRSDVALASEKGGVGIHLAEHAFALLLGLTRGLHTALRDPDYRHRRMNDLLAQSDVLVICLPLTKATHHLFSRDLFRRMKPGAILINVTRGAIVHGEDLMAALDQELIGGAGLDVTDPEPLPAGHPLWRHPRVIVTPHTAGGSPRRADRVIDTLCENLRRMRAGQPLTALIDKEKGY